MNQTAATIILTAGPVSTSRSLRQEEIDGYWRMDFINQVLSQLKGGREIKFLAIKHHYSLITISGSDGEWHFSAADKHYYTYRFSDLIDFIEKLYDSGANIVMLKGEIEISATHRTANPDAELSPTLAG